MTREQQLKLFRRSARIDSPEAYGDLNGYILTQRGLEIVSQLLDALRSKDYKAFSITGPYGSGKSSFALFLTALFLGEESKAYQTAISLLKSDSQSLAESVSSVRHRFGAEKKGFFIIRATAHRAPLLTIIQEGLVAALEQLEGSKRLWSHVHSLVSVEKPEESDILKAFDAVRTEWPILLCIDEFGKVLEWFSEHRRKEGDVYILQQLIERSESKSHNPISILTLQHLAFDEYTADSARLQQREWAKIQGRFRDYPFSDSSGTTAFLMRRCLERLDLKPPSDFATVWTRAKNIIPSLDLDLGTKTLAPLHPLTAVLLPELCSKYGQHERSLFKFLRSSDEGSLNWLIGKNQLINGWVMPFQLYNYFVSSSAHTSVLPTLSQRWIEVQTRLRDAVGLTEFELEILKTVGVFNLCSSSGKIRANRELLDWILTDRAPEQYPFEVALSHLISSGFITYRDQSDEYRIWRGSDFDLSEQVRLLVASHKNEPIDSLLTKTLKLEPLIATRHSQQHCLVRLFQQCFASHRSSLLELSPSFVDPDGLLVWWLGNTVPKNLELPTWAHTVILIRVRQPDDVRQLVDYAHAYQALLKGSVIPEHDWVAKRETIERSSIAMKRLEQQVIPLLQVSPESIVEVIKPKGLRLNQTGHRSSTSVLSLVCDMVYPDTPRIPNEMLSRRELTSQGAKARRVLIESLANKSEEPLCGLNKGYGPERAMFEALAALHGLQSSEKGLKWPDANSSITPCYKCINEFFGDSRHNKRPLSELWSILKSPPIGLKEGPIPVIVAHYLLLHDDKIGLYEDGRFIPVVDTAVIERLSKNPGTFHCSSFALNDLQHELVRDLLETLGINRPSSITLLYAVRQLLRQARTWPSHTRHTNEISLEAKAVRKAVIGAKEPDQFIFIDLPRAVGTTELSYRSLKPTVDAIARCLTELNGRFSLLLEEMKESVGDALKVIDPSVREEITSRAAKLRSKVLDPKLRAFILALADHELPKDTDWIQRVGLSIVGRAPAEWIDTDLVRFRLALSELAPAFLRIEALYFNHDQQNRPGFSSIRLGITTSDGADHQRVISYPKAQANRLEEFISKVKAEAIDAFGQDGASVVLAEWAQQMLNNNNFSEDPLA